MLLLYGVGLDEDDGVGCVQMEDDGVGTELVQRFIEEFDPYYRPPKVTTQGVNTAIQRVMAVEKLILRR